MDENTEDTKFAAAARATATVVKAQAEFFDERPLLRKFTDAYPDIFLILNEQRQIVFANQALLKLAGLPCDREICGLRPGELLDCVHACDEKGGCGTSEFCSTCGAVAAIESSLRGREEVQECRLIQCSGDALDLRVWANPAEFDGRRYSLFTVKDISHEKRRRVLERIFFHDILNTAGGVRGVAELLAEATPEEMDEFKAMIEKLANNLIDEITSQQQIVAGEAEELAVRPESVPAAMLLERVVEQYCNHEVAKEREVCVVPGPRGVMLTTDPALAGRVLGNMLKNALEASRPGQAVTIGFAERDGGVEFSTHNDTEIPREVQLQLFQRSFSTKGAGRGLGTYSMKLLGEKYLKGRVWFESAPGEGTTFKLLLPVDYPAAGAVG